MSKLKSIALDIGLVIAFAVALSALGPALEGLPTDTEADQAVADFVVAARIDEEVRYRVALMYVEGERP